MVSTATAGKRWDKVRSMMSFGRKKKKSTQKTDDDAESLHNFNDNFTGAVDSS